jgi:hypothetical protein
MRTGFASLDIGLFAIHIVHSLGCSYQC